MLGTYLIPKSRL